MTRPSGSAWSRLTGDAPWHRVTAERLHELRRRWHRVLVLSLLTGLAVGLAVAGFDWLAAHVLLAHVTQLPEAAQILIPGAGLVVSTFLLRSLGRTTPAISDDYLRAYH